MHAVLAVAVVVGVICTSCTKPNPRSCADGTCTDPTYPFCDVDGAIEGEPMSCISVTCTPDEIAGCRASQAITCNSSGTNFDLIMCPRGCDPVGGCRECATSSECNNPHAICDAQSGQCRACAVDDECASLVCDAGTCVDEAAVVYASPTGSNVANGTQTQPASLSRAITLALATPRIVRLVPGLYAGSIAVLSSASMPLNIVATGATVSGPDYGIHVSGGANVKVRGISVTGFTQAVRCGSGSTAISSLTVEDSIIFEDVVASSAATAATNCTLKLQNVDLRARTNDESVLVITTGARFEADRLHVHGAAHLALGTLGSNISVRVMNSILEDVQIILNTSDTGGTGSQAYFGFNTIVFKTALSSMSCASGADAPTVLLENNVMVALGASSTVDGCTLVNNVLFPQPSAPAGNIVADPQFMDAAAGDFHLRATSPALGAATDTPTLFTDHDFNNVSRPQGTGPDIGAYEQ